MTASPPVTCGLVHDDAVGLEEAVELLAAVAPDVGLCRGDLEGVPHPAEVLLRLAPRRACRRRSEQKPRSMRGLVHDDGVLYVVALEREDGDDRVGAERPLVDVEQLGALGLDHRRLRVDQQVLPDEGREREGGRREAQALLRHRRLVGVPRRLVVLRVGDDRGGDAEHGSRVELEVGVLGGGLLGRHRHEAVLLLVRVEHLDDAPLDDVPPGELVRRRPCRPSPG